MTKARDIADFKFENITDTGTEGTKVASGTTGQRGSTTGQFRFNTTTNLAEYYTGTDFKSIDAPPTVASINPTSATTTGVSIVITGTNFQTGATVKFIGNDGTEYASPSVTVNSSTQVTATTPSSLLPSSKEPYDVQVSNTSGLSGTGTDLLDTGGVPAWSTASGQIGGNIIEGDAVSTTVSASDPDGTAIVYSVVSGSLPSGLSINSSSGAITGTAPSVSGDTTSSFTLRAASGNDNTDRAFNIVVKENPVIQTNLNYDWRAVDFSGSAGTISSGTNVGSCFGSRVNASVFSGSSDTNYGDLTFTTNDSYAPSGKCFTFANNGVVQIQADSQANYNTYFNSPSSYTWVMWFDWGGNSREGFYSRYGTSGDTDGTIYHFNHMMDSTTQFHYNQSGPNLAAANLSNGTWQITSGNQWQHIVISYDHTTGDQKWYIDGSLYGTVAMGTNSGSGMSAYNNNQTPHTLGGRTDDTQKFTGKIAEARTYRAALSASQVSAEWTATKGNYGRS